MKNKGTVPLKASFINLISILQDARKLLSRPGNEFCWSSWVSEKEALEEVDHIMDQLHRGSLSETSNLKALFAPTGPIQEVSLSSGWAEEFLRLSERFDDTIEKF